MGVMPDVFCRILFKDDMTREVRSITISGNGTNCEMETAFALKRAGADVSDIVHISELIYGEVSLDDYHILTLAGGFLDGDDLGSARAMASRLRFATIKGTEELLIDKIFRFIEDKKLIIGICNGFQLMVKAGLLPAIDGSYGDQSATITFNDSGRFEDRWIRLTVNEDSPSIYTRGIKELYLPIRHGEGKFVASEHLLDEMDKKNLVTFRYADSRNNPTMEYPENPNGSYRAIAGISDETGRLLALMPHPEGYLFKTQHPRWTREVLPDEGAGLAIFRNAVDYVKRNLI